MDADGFGWMQMDADGCGWMRMDADGCGGMQMVGLPLKLSRRSNSMTTCLRSSNAVFFLTLLQDKFNGAVCPINMSLVGRGRLSKLWQS